MGVILLGQIKRVHWKDPNLMSDLAEVGSYSRTFRMVKRSGSPATRGTLEGTSVCSSGSRWCSTIVSLESDRSELKLSSSTLKLCELGHNTLCTQFPFP